MKNVVASTCPDINKEDDVVTLPSWRNHRGHHAPGQKLTTAQRKNEGLQVQHHATASCLDIVHNLLKDDLPYITVRMAHQKQDRWWVRMDGAFRMIGGVENIPFRTQERAWNCLQSALHDRYGHGRTPKGSAIRYDKTLFAVDFFPIQNVRVTWRVMLREDFMELVKPGRDVTGGWR